MELSQHTQQAAPHGSKTSYIVGFVLSLFLTLSAYFLATLGVLEKSTLIKTVVALGSLQVIVQLILFLHVGQEEKPYWNLIAFLFMVLVLFILVLGTMWIMNNLQERTMSSDDMGSFMQKEECIHKHKN